MPDSAQLRMYAGALAAPSPMVGRNFAMRHRPIPRIESQNDTPCLVIAFIFPAKWHDLYSVFKNDLKANSSCLEELA